MIKPETYTIQWIKTIAKANHNADPILVEKVIRALTLLVHLAVNDLDFVFKGGTSLLLILDEPKRLSIDIDIIINDGHADLPALFNRIILAFAPTTTGIPYEKHGDSMSMEIIKQLFDISLLFDRSTNLDIIRKSFLSIAAVELQYRNHRDKSIPDVHEDIFQTALTISSRGIIGNGNYVALQEGIQKISRFIFADTFYLDKAIIAAAKTAYINALLKSKKSSIEKFSDSSQINEWIREDPSLNKLNKLKKSNPEAFFYWHRTVNV